jgi:hypothetical protein
MRETGRSIESEQEDQVSAEAIAESRRGEEIKALTAKRAACERSLKDWRPIPSYDPGGNLARAEKQRREDLRRQADTCTADIKALGKMKQADLIAKFCPEVEAQRRRDELVAAGYSTIDTLARGASR